MGTSRHTLRAAAAPAAALVLTMLAAGCAGGPSPAGSSPPPSGPSSGPGGTGSVSSAPSPSSDVSSPPAQPSSPVPTPGCGPASSPPAASTGSAASLVTVRVEVPPSVAVGSPVGARTVLEVSGDGPRVVLRPAASALYLLDAGRVVAVAAGSGPEIPLPLRAGARWPGQAVPTAVGAVGCDGAPVAAGRYDVVAVVAYGTDPANSAQGGSAGGFALVSAPVEVRIS